MPGPLATFKAMPAINALIAMTKNPTLNSGDPSQTKLHYLQVFCVLKPLLRNFLTNSLSEL
jgi:hypothetical protein